MVTLHFACTFGHVRLPFCMVFAIVFATFWHFNLSFAWYLPHFGTSNVHAGFLRVFSGVHLKFHLRFHSGFHVGFHVWLFRVLFRVSFRVSLGFHVGFHLGFLQGFI